tara:strand:+ start:50 stop:625 length:576 start_codon:yes stop_codon:yes gene_type:complete
MTDYFYKCLPKKTYQNGGYTLEAVQPEHIEKIRKWRNAQMHVLRQMEIITPEQQQYYFDTCVWPEMSKQQPSNLLLTYLFDDDPIGYGGLVNVDWDHRRAEVSFIVSPERSCETEIYTRDQTQFLGLVKALAFDQMNFLRLFTETYDIREQHIVNLENAGFRREGVMRGHVLINGQPVDSFIHGCLSTYER